MTNANASLRLEYALIVHRTSQEHEIIGNTQNSIKVLAECFRQSDKIRIGVDLSSIMMRILNSLDETSYQQKKNFYAYQRSFFNFSSFF